MRITGVFRGQSDAVAAPAGFEGMISPATLSGRIADSAASQQQVEGQYSKEPLTPTSTNNTQAETQII